jgi:hypothetical protein
MLPTPITAPAGSPAAPSPVAVAAAGCRALSSSARILRILPQRLEQWLEIGGPAS